MATSFPLVEAAQAGNLQEVTRLLDSGVNVNQRDGGGETALMKATDQGYLEIATLLLDRGASIDLQENSAGWTALMGASYYGKANIVSLLLERGANSSIKSKSGKTALDWAREKNKIDCIAILQNPPPTITIAMRQQQQREEVERRNRKREIEEQKQREKQQEIEENKRNRELVSSLSTQLQQKDQEILILKDQLSSREDSLRNSERRILELTNEKKQAIERNDKSEKELLKEKEKFDNQIQVLSKQLNSSQSTNRDQEEQLKELMKKMETKDQLLVEKETLLTNLREELSRCGFQLKEVIERNNKLEKEFLKEKEKFDNQIQVLSKQLNFSQSTNREQEEQLREMMKKMETKDQLLVEKETLLTNLRDELSRCGFQLGELKTKLECSENDIANLREELEEKNKNEEKEKEKDTISKLSGMSVNFLQELQELKNMLVERFHHQRLVEINEAKHEEYLELNEKIKKTKDKKLLHSLNSKLKSLNYDPNNTIDNESLDIVSLEEIESKANELYSGLKSREEQFMEENDIVSSLLCEVDRLNLLNLLKVFEVEVRLEDEDNGHEQNRDLKEVAENNEKNQIISNLQEQLNFLRCTLIVKEGELKEKQSIITRFESKLGIGLKDPHVRVESFKNDNNKDHNEDVGRDLVDGIYHRRGQDIPCKLKMATNPLQHSHLERERRILETIRRNDTHGQQSQFIVTLLNSEEFLTDESDNLYFFTKEGELSPPSSLFSSPMKSLVFESGGLNLKQFMLENRLSVPVIQRVQILREIVRALEFLHELGIVHFDLKPENIVSFSSLSGSNVRWKLIDFDTSYDVSSSSPIMIRYPSNDAAPAAIRVTEEYTSPEIMRILNHNHNPNNQDTPVLVDVEVSWKIDIWSLGMIGVFLLSNYSLWDLLYPTIPFKNTMVSSVSQEKIQLLLTSNSYLIGEKEKSFLEGSLQVEEGKRMNTSELLQKKLFSTDNSTVQMNLLRLSSDQLNQQLADVHSNLSTGMERMMK